MRQVCIFPVFLVRLPIASCRLVLRRCCVVSCLVYRRSFNMTFNNLTLTEYLDKCWDIMQFTNAKQRNKSIKGITAVRLCSSHTCKTTKDLIGVYFRNKSENINVCRMIRLIFNIIDFELLLTY